MEGPFDQYDEHTFSSSVEPVIEALAAGAKRLGATVKDLFTVVTHFFTRTRWSRMFDVIR